MGGYDPNVVQQQYDDRERVLHEELTICRKVKQTIDTKGWKEIIEPLLDKLIIDVVGAKVDGRWCPGSVDRARKDERREYHIGYKSALIKLHNLIYSSYIDQITVKEKELKSIDALKKKGTVVPMVEDSRYAPRMEEL